MQQFSLVFEDAEFYADFKPKAKPEAQILNNGIKEDLTLKLKFVCVCVIGLEETSYIL